MQTHYLYSRVVRSNVYIGNKECIITLTDSGLICLHMWKGTISRKNVHLCIHIVNIENTVLSTTCLSCHIECIDLYIHIHLSRLGRKSVLIKISLDQHWLRSSSSLQKKQKKKKQKKTKKKKKKKKKKTKKKKTTTKNRINDYNNDN